MGQVAVGRTCNGMKQPGTNLHWDKTTGIAILRKELPFAKGTFISRKEHSFHERKKLFQI